MSAHGTLWTLVTGGAKGLGAEICKQLAQSGHPIAIQYNTSVEAAEDVCNTCRGYGVKAEIIQGDFSSPNKVERFSQEFLSRFSAVHNLINNVGNYLNKPILGTTAEEWHDLFQVNVHTPLALINALVPSIKYNKGSIINVGVSGLHAMQSKVTNTAYGASKQCLLTITRALARELAPFHVRVNMVSPGQLENSVDHPLDLSKLPMGRLGTIYEAARVVAFLLEKDSAYITGQNIEISGGL